jgi:hypothetical protein
MANKRFTARGPHNINLQMERDAMRVTITSLDGTKIVMHWSRSEVADVVTGLCQEAGLPRPW